MRERFSGLEYLTSGSTSSGEKGGSKWKKIFLWGAAGAILAGAALGSVGALIGGGAGAYIGSKRP